MSWAKRDGKRPKAKQSKKKDALLLNYYGMHNISEKTEKERKRGRHKSERANNDLQSNIREENAHVSFFV